MKTESMTPEQCALNDEVLKVCNNIRYFARTHGTEHAPLLAQCLAMATKLDQLEKQK